MEKILFHTLWSFFFAVNITNLSRCLHHFRLRLHQRFYGFFCFCEIFLLFRRVFFCLYRHFFLLLQRFFRFCRDFFSFYMNFFLQRLFFRDFFAETFFVEIFLVETFFEWTFFCRDFFLAMTETFLPFSKDFFCHLVRFFAAVKSFFFSFQRDFFFHFKEASLNCIYFFGLWFRAQKASN